MGPEIIIYIIIAGIAALLLALFQYVYKSKKRSGLYRGLSFLRFLTIFSILLLLINPKFDAVTYYDEKPNLIVALDNSESVAYLKQDEKAKQLFNNIVTNSELNKQFNIQSYTFGSDFKPMDSINFDDSQSNLSEALKSYSDIYKNSNSPIIFISDGNQTYGSDYQYMANKINQEVYPVILGDTVSYSDLRVQQLNVNRYAYLKNRFPIEIIANYTGTESVNTQLKIWSDNSVLFSKQLSFNASKSSEIISTTLLASRVGVQSYSVEMVPLDNEKNTVNNYKNFAVEVIDQKTNVAIVTERLHPDLGALKKAIESNEQRSVVILSPNEYIPRINDFQLVILYQPNSNFRNVLDEISRLKLNTFTITGNTTDWNILNQSQSFYNLDITNQTEEFQPTLNANYDTFIVDNLDFENYPPLHSEFGELTFKIPNQTLLYKTVNGNTTTSPLLNTFENDNQKHAILLGEGIWRWRAQAYLDSESFADFDNFLGKLVQYLSSNKKRNRINMDYKSFYYGNENLIISAQYFNKNYEFDANAEMEIVLKNRETNTSQTYPLLLNTNNYNVDLSGITSGDYAFTIKNKNEPISASGNFKVLEYKVEQQFLSADVSKLEALATNTDGKSYFIDSTQALVPDLLKDKRYVTIQKSNKTIVPLIDWKYLLGLIALALSLEWFIRKYNGLI